jgi:hypothetical protein
VGAGLAGDYAWIKKITGKAGTYIASRGNSGVCTIRLNNATP